MSQKWVSIQSQKQLLDEIAKKLNVKQPHDWVNVRQKEFIRNGGGSALQHYNNSLSQMLKTVYTEIEWNNDWLSKNWKSKNEQRAFFNKLSKKFNIQKPSDWGNITTRAARKYGASTILSLHGGSLFRALVSNFPEEIWKEEWFEKVPQKHWTSKENQKFLFDKLAIEFKIQKPSDWGKISIKEALKKERVSSVLSNMYKNSLFNALCSIYPSIQWKREWFPISKYPSGYFDSIHNQRKFFETIATNYNIHYQNDWHRVSNNLIRKCGGTLLLERYHNSLALALRTIYPAYATNIEKGNSSRPHEFMINKISLWT